MIIGNDLTTEVVRLAMGMQQLRAEVSARNIASANTPGVTATRLDFGSSQSLLNSAIEASATGDGDLVQQLEAAQSRPLASESVDPVGSPIQLDEEVANMASASGQYQTLTEALNRHMGLMRLAITGRN